MTSDRKLYVLTEPKFELPRYVKADGRGTVTMPAGSIPMMHWPDGHWCIEGNVYMLQLYRRGFSRLNGGGTLLTYASNVTHLIRFCYREGIRIIDLSDADFTRFIDNLVTERRPREPEIKARSTNSVIAIGRTCLEMLICVGKYHNDPQFVGQGGRIEVERRRAHIGTDRGHRGGVVVSYLHHHSFPTKEPFKRRLAISDENVAKLHAAVLPASSSSFLRKRRYVMLKLLEISCGRRSEIAALTVDSVRAAMEMRSPKLRVLNAKRRGGRVEYRLIPVARSDLVFLIEYIEKNRRRIIRRTCGFDADEGTVLVSETTGHKLNANTITQEVAILVAHANITEQACAHMFRHRYITKLFLELIKQHGIANVDDFRRALHDVEGLKDVVREFAGQTGNSSLQTYIHAALKEHKEIGKTYSIVKARRAMDGFTEHALALAEELERGDVTGSNAATLLRQLLSAIDSDLAEDSAEE